VIPVSKRQESSKASRITPSLRGRVWVENNRAAAMTEAGSDLLEQIQACGSLSEAARRLGFSYRRAWLLLDAMNHAWPQPVVVTAVGGKQGGGARVTEFGLLVLRSYRDVQLQMEHLLDLAAVEFSAAVNS
jgi:molybdate transport system regulatory protein